VAGAGANGCRWVTTDCSAVILTVMAFDVGDQFVANPDNATRWYVNIKSISWQTPPPAVVGSRIGGTDDVFLDAPGEPEDLERLKAILEDRQLSRTLG